MKADMMCNWLYQQQLERMWSTNGLEEGVVLKKTKDDYKCAPADLLSHRDGFFDAVQKLNVKVILNNPFTPSFFPTSQDVFLLVFLTMHV